MKPARRTVQSAKFITAGETASHVQLGADGQLPDLVLREGEQREKPSEEKQGVNPLVLVAVLVSVLMTVAVLFLDDAGVGGSTASKDAARAVIKQHYIDVPRSIDPTSLNKPYQYYLRAALQAHSRGDAAAEMRNYRHVMNLLHSEGISKISGLTGRIGSVQTEKTDRHLEHQLSILLSD
ncbi:MAG: hypothetical protein RIC55_32465 [Pirellulaceae bacterium]